MVKSIVYGANGRMGGATTALALQNNNIELVGLCDVPKERDKLTALYSESNICISDDLSFIIQRTDADVVIDFTSPSATIEMLKSVSKNPIPLVICTTGFAKEEAEYITFYAQETPVVFAPNMSVGVNILLKVLADIAKVTGDDYDVEISETHHKHKKDAPSGTAMKMARVIAAALNRNLEDTVVYARHGMIGERSAEEIGIQTHRIGDVVGEHTVMFGGNEERIEITHKASSRNTFARGALKAAQWVVKQTPGLYDMQDVLGLK